MAKKTCPHKKLIGKKLEWMAIPGGVPQKCVSCGLMFVTEIPKVIKTPGARDVYLCQSCLTELVCDKCGRKVKEESMYVAECMRCNKVFFFCERCAKKRLYINMSDSPDPEELVSKLYAIVEELMEMGKNPRGKFSLLNFFKKKKRPDIRQLFPLIMNINMYFTEDMNPEFYDEGFENEDWWSN